MMLVAALTLLLMLGGCAKPDLSIPVSGVNYSDRELAEFLFMDPKDENHFAGGMPLRPFQGGGQMCCYKLPSQWKAGTKVNLRYAWYEPGWEKKLKSVTFEVPEYPASDPGVLWALFFQDGTVEVVASAVAPNNPQWPGKVKGWPVPTREYRLKEWQEEYGLLVHKYESFMRRAKRSTAEELEQSWKHREKYEPQNLAQYSGPNDPRFRVDVMKSFEVAAESVKADLDRMQANRP